MKNLLPKTPPHPRKKIIQFWIDESVAHYRIPISGNHEISITTNALKKNLILILKPKQHFSNIAYSSTLLHKTTKNPSPTVDIE